MGFTTLILADHGVKVNVKHYRDILQSQQMLTAVKSVTRDTFIFQPISLVRSFSCCNATLRLHRCDLWPPSSPDLNSDDYKISGVMQQRVYKTRVNNLDELKQRLMEIWSGLQRNIADLPIGIHSSKTATIILSGLVTEYR